MNPLSHCRADVSSSILLVCVFFLLLRLNLILIYFPTFPVNGLKAKYASLQADVIQAKKRPSSSQIQKAAKLGRTEVSNKLQRLNRKAAEVEERCILYRTAGWTVFEIDLDVGRRDREARRRAIAAQGEKAALGLGIRLETFHGGRFYEPFYLIFAKPSQLVKKGMAKILAPMPEEITENKKRSNRVQLVRHTIPHFIPLGEIFHFRMRPEEDDDDDGDAEGTKGEGGLELLDHLMTQRGLSLFLSKLHAYLQSFVSRRQQAISLGQLELPGLTISSIRAFGNDSFGQLNVRWDLPLPTQKDMDNYNEGKRVIYPRKDELDAIVPNKNQRSEGIVNTALEVSIVYHDLSSDRVGIACKESDVERQDIADDEAHPGLKCTFATVHVEVIRTRVPPARRGESSEQEKIQIRRARRPDWELVFTQPQDALPTAMGAVMELVWREELKRVSIAKD